jgi:hypothetical protein
MSLKNPVTRPGIDPGTFRLVAQRIVIVEKQKLLHILSLFVALIIHHSMRVHNIVTCG